MSFFEIFLIALGLSMDAFAVAVCIGIGIKKFSIGKAFIVGLYFGLFQAIMPLIGYVAATRFAEHIMQFGHWVAFGLLVILGGRMVWGSFKKDEQPDNHDATALKFLKMLPLALATSVDALAVGVSFAFLYVRIVPSVVMIGVTTFVLSVVGVKVGSIFGLKFKAKAELVGGVILILMGVRVLFGG